MSTHRIASGDTFWNLAQRYGCLIEDIQRVNPGVVPEQLQIGQVIRLPGGGGNSGRSENQGGGRNSGHSANQVGGKNSGRSANQRDPSLTGEPPYNARLDTTLNRTVPHWCEPLRDMINAASQTANVPADLIAAVIYQESGGNVNVNATRNPNGGSDSGLMQVNQYTAVELERKYPHRFNRISGPAKNIMLGTT